MMFFLGLLLLVAPALLNNIFASIGLLAAVLIIFSLTISISRKINPRIIE
jgi:hypothetical protein